MKLLSAKFQNFRLLRDLEIQFSVDAEKNLTVFRAANESGKTTILHALQWALYGDEALPNKGEGFRLHPIDWDANDGNPVPVTATIELERTTHRRVAGTIRKDRKRYRLVRFVFEDVDGQKRRPTSTVQLFEQDSAGDRSIESPEPEIKEMLPPELREIFFTDGDRALSFIEADASQSAKRVRVQLAIRSLLGLGIIGDAIKHVRKSASEVTQKAKHIDIGSELNNLALRIEKIDQTWEKYEAELEDAKQQLAAFDEKLNGIDRMIDAALQKGDKEELQKELEATRRDIKKFDEQLVAANKEHSELFQSSSIATALLAQTLGRARKKLEILHDQGKIPNTTIPILQDRLLKELCICGETLQFGDPENEKRRTHIQHLIDESQQADEIQKTITDLYYSARPLQSSETSNTSVWLEDYKKVVERRDGLQSLRDDTGRKFRTLEQQLDTLPNTDIQGLRETRRKYKDLRDKFLGKQSTLETQLTHLRKERDQLESQLRPLLRKKKEGTRILAEQEVTQDVMGVLDGAYAKITNEELAKVSNQMNTLFLDMIGADPEQGAIIQRTEISLEFDIIVYGPNDRTLNPDRDLNGASRRALTLAFILALTKVSEVKAPNIIDTPLGMTSGYVKRSILKTATQESEQLVLFLTHDEIDGCENILDETAGMVCTLTNPAHYPKMLVNDPGVTERKVLRCECDHQSHCQLCERRVGP